MASKVGKIAIDVSARTAGFKRDMNEARRSLQSNASLMSSAIHKVRGGFESTLKTIFSFRGALIATAAAGAMGMFIKKSIDAADELSKMAQKIGISTESLSTLAYAAKLSDVSLSSLETAVVRLSRNMSDATKGTGEAREAFAALGVDVRDTNGGLKSSEEMLKELADKFAGMTDGATKTALATQLFGRAGADLIPMLNQGAGEIENLEQRARDMGLELSTAAGIAAEEFNDRLTELKESAAGLGREMAVELLPQLNGIVESMVEANKEGNLLAAVWAGLTGLGKAAFTDAFDTTSQKLAAARKELEFIEERMAGAEGTWGPSNRAADLRVEIRQLEIKLEAEREAAAQAREQRAEEQAARQETTRRIAEELASTREKESREKAAIAAAKTKREKEAEAHAAFMAEMEQVEESYDVLDQAIKELNWSLEKAGEAVEEINWDYIDEGNDHLAYLLRTMEQTEDEVNKLEMMIRGWGEDSARAIQEFVTAGKGSFKDMIDSMIADLLRMLIYQEITKPLFGWVSGGMSGLFSAKGNAFSGGKVIPMARGGIVDRPTVFPMAQGIGLMGEAGPEAVMPLSRTSTGELGVQADGGGGTNIVIYAADAKSFQDMCRRNPDAINEQLLRGLRDNKTRAEMRNLTR